LPVRNLYKDKYFFKKSEVLGKFENKKGIHFVELIKSLSAYTWENRFFLDLKFSSSWKMTILPDTQFMSWLRSHFYKTLKIGSHTSISSMISPPKAVTLTTVVNKRSSCFHSTAKLYVLQDHKHNISHGELIEKFVLFR
jgi:hypothetical protein